MYFKLPFLLLLLVPGTLCGQQLYRLQYETATDFAARVKPVQQLRIVSVFDKVLETRLWDNQTSVIIAFYQSRTNEQDLGDDYIEAVVYVPVGDNLYQRVLIDTFRTDSNTEIRIESVFFANADPDKEKELAILFSQDFGETHMGEGWHYNTRIYDHINFRQPPKQLQQLPGFEETFAGLEGSIDDGPLQKAKYKTAADVRKRLKELGF